MKGIIVPDECLICGNNGHWKGGSQLPYKKLKPNGVVFYECGCSIWYRVIDDVIPIFELVIKGCNTIADDD